MIIVMPIIKRWEEYTTQRVPKAFLLRSGIACTLGERLVWGKRESKR